MMKEKGQLLKANGTECEVLPKNGTDFSLEELQGFVGGYVELIYFHDGYMLVLKDDAYLDADKQVNETATELVKQHGIGFIFPEEKVWGDALFCKEELVK